MRTGKLMLGVLLSRKGYVILETGNETRRSRPPLTEWYSTVQYVQYVGVSRWQDTPVRACSCASCVCVRPGN